VVVDLLSYSFSFIAVNILKAFPFSPAAFRYFLTECCHLSFSLENAKRLETEVAFSFSRGS